MIANIEWLHTLNNGSMNHIHPHAVVSNDNEEKDTLHYGEIT
jgi:hypothetical protein